MKNYKLKLGISILSICLVFAIAVSCILLSNAFGDNLEFEIPTYNQTYVVGENIEVQDAFVEVSGENKKLSSTVIYPDGRTTDATNVSLDMVGKYTVSYKIKVDDDDYEKTCEFSAVRTMASQFIVEQDCVVTPNVASPENTGLWSDDYSTNPVSKKFDRIAYTGVSVKATSALSHLRYNGIINLAELGRDEPFVEYLFTPEKMGELEAGHLTFVLTDVHDPSNYVTIKLESNALYGPYQASSTALFSVSDNYTPAGMREYDFYAFICPHCGEITTWNANIYEVIGTDQNGTEIGRYTCPKCNEVAEGTKLKRDLLYLEGDYKGPYQYAWQGTTIRSSFYGQYGSQDSYISMPLYFDNENPSVWCKSKFYWCPEKQWKIFDFNNTDIVGTNFWDGFTTGEVYCDIYIGGSASGATVLFTKINGIDLSAEVDAITTPTAISIDYKGLNERELPNGVAGEGYKYRVPEVVAYSQRCGVISNVKANVYYGVERKQIPVEDGFFKTAEDGEYTIEYKATDENGNVATKKVTVKVLPEYENPIAFEFDERLGSAYRTSTTNIYLYGGSASGGVGVLNTEVKVLFGTENVEIFRDGTLEYFKPTKAGTYNVVYTVSDYIGTNVEFVKEISVLSDGVPTISNLYLPDAIRKDYDFNMPKPVAKIADEDGNLTDAIIEIYVNDQKINGNTYKPTEVGSVKIEYRAINPADGSKVATVTKQVAVLGVNETSYYSSYIYTDGINYKDQTFDYVAYDVVNTEKASFMLANKLSSTNAGAQFTFAGNGGVVEKFRITFIDANNGTEVAVDVLNVENKPVAYHYGIKLGELEGQFSGFNGKELAVYVDGSGYFKDVTNSAIGKIQYTTDGREFKGFTDSVYVKVEIFNAQPNTVLEIRKIGNQPIYSDVADWCIPSLYFEANVASLVEVKINEKIIVPKAKAFDVMGQAEIPTITIDAPDGSVLVRNQPIDEDYTFTATQFGNYKVTYYVSDGSNSGKANTIVYTVIDDTAPVIGEISVSKLIYKVGDKFEVPEFTAEDDLDAEDKIVKYVLVCDYEDMYRIVTDSYTFTTVGKYRIRFCAVDSSYNLSYKEVIVYCV